MDLGIARSRRAKNPAKELKNPSRASIDRSVLILSRYRIDALPGFPPVQLQQPRLHALTHATVPRPQLFGGWGTVGGLRCLREAPSDTCKYSLPN